jgi:hypothetical protein
MDQHTAILWQGLNIPGHEFAELAPAHDGWRLSGIALLAYEQEPCCLQYQIECDAAWYTRRVVVHGYLRAAPLALDLVRTTQGIWHANGMPVPAVDGCADVDLGFSPSTNLLPIRRLALSIGEEASVRAAWVRLPDLGVEPLEQVYTRIGDQTYRYESADGTFRRDLVVDASGFVVDYPGLWRAVGVHTDLHRPVSAPSSQPSSS